MDKKRVVRHGSIPAIAALAAILCCLASCEIAEYPYFMKYMPSPGMIWISNSAHGSVTAVDSRTNVVVATYAVDAFPSRLVVDNEGGAWVACRDAGTVCHITKAGAIAKFSGFSLPRGVAVDRSNNIWVVNSGNNTIQKITTGPGAPVVSEQMAFGPGLLYGSLIDWRGNLFVVSPHNAIYKYDTARFPDPAALQTLIQGNVAYSFTVDPNGKLWTVLGSSLVRIDSSTMALDESYPTVLFTDAIGLTFDVFGKIWIAPYAGAAVTDVVRFDPATATFQDFPGRSTYSWAVAADEAGFVYVISYWGGPDVNKLDAATGDILTSYSYDEVIGPPGAERHHYTNPDATGFVYRSMTQKGTPFRSLFSRGF